MVRAFLFAAFFVFAALTAQAAETAAPVVDSSAGGVLQQMQTLSAEQARLSKRLGELMAFEEIYAAKTAKLAPEAKRLKGERLLIGKEQAVVNGLCQSRVFKSSREYKEANRICKEARTPLDKRIQEYQADLDAHKGEVAELGKAEDERKALQDETAGQVEEIKKQIAELEKQLPESKQKECAKACNAQPPEGTAECLKKCIDGGA